MNEVARVNAALVSFVEEFSDVEDALNDASTPHEALKALERSSRIFARHAESLEAAGMAVYDTASEIFMEFRQRVFEQVTVL